MPSCYLLMKPKEIDYISQHKFQTKLSLQNNEKNNVNIHNNFCDFLPQPENNKKG